LQQHNVTHTAGGGFDVSFQFQDSSRAVLRYHRATELKGPKEIANVRWEDKRWHIEDFLRAEIFERDSLKESLSWKSKGHRECLDAFATAIAQRKKGKDPYGFIASSKLVLEIAQEIHDS
jgi:hypothetical protein